MLRFRLLVSLTTALTFSPSFLSAQWLNYPTAGVPRTADGKPNLSAPAPRMANGKPDLSGLWEMDPKLRLPAAVGEGDAVSPEFIDIGFSRRNLARRYGQPPDGSRQNYRAVPSAEFHGHLDIAITVDDPKAYTKPWMITLKQTIRLDTDLLDYFVNENEKDLQHFAPK